MVRRDHHNPFRYGIEGAEVTGDIWSARGPVVVLLHPGVADRRCWYQVVPLLPDELTVVAYDYRGYGDSPAAADSFTHLSDLVGVLDEVAGAEPVVLVGSSLGGGIALDAAAEFPDRVSGLVLLAPAISGAPDPTIDPATQRLVDEVEAATAARLMDAAEAEARIWLDGLGPSGRVGGPARELMLEMNRRIDASGAQEGAGASKLDTWSWLERIRAPTTVICGDLDLPFLLERSAEVCRRIPTARWITIPGTAHLPYLEQPATVARWIGEAVTAAARPMPPG